MADLFNQQISATYSGLLKTTSSGVLTSSLTQITDGRGNGSPLYISTTVGEVDGAINFYNAYTFTSEDGDADQVLSTNAGGVLSWVDVGSGDVNVSGTPSADQIAIWTNATTIKGDPTLTIDTNGEIILVQDGQSGTPSRGMYNIGGGNMSVATGEENTGFGKQNLNNTEGGYHNTAVGAYSLFSLTGGVYNVAIGRNSLYSLIDQSSNTAVGNSSALNFIGSSGTFIGALSGGKRLSGSSNTAIGVNSLVGNSTVSLNTGNSNTAIGDASLNVVSSGSKNVALGKSSGSLITTGSSNVIIGSFTGTTGESPTPVYDIRTSSNNIVISDGDGNIRQTFDASGAATFSGALSGTSATFSGLVSLGGATATNPLSIRTKDGESYIRFLNADGSSYGDFERSITGSGAIRFTGAYFRFANQLEVTGAATFSSSVTAEDGFISNSDSFNPNGFYKLRPNPGITAARWWKITSDNVDYGDFSIAQSSANSDDSYTNILYFNATGAATFSGQINANNGISFPTPSPASSGTVSSSVLDAYEEGTWIPTFAGNTTSGTYTTSSVTATYTRIGNLCTVQCDTSFSAASGGTGTYIIMGGFPYSYNGIAGFTNNVSSQNLTYSGELIILPTGGGPGSTFLLAENKSGLGYSFIPPTSLTTSVNIRYTYTYKV